MNAVERAVHEVMTQVHKADKEMQDAITEMGVPVTISELGLPKEYADRPATIVERVRWLVADRDQYRDDAAKYREAFGAKKATSDAFRERGNRLAELIETIAVKCPKCHHPGIPWPGPADIRRFQCSDCDHGWDIGQTPAVKDLLRRVEALEGRVFRAVTVLRDTSSAADAVREALLHLTGGVPAATVATGPLPGVGLTGGEESRGPAPPDTVRRSFTLDMDDLPPMTLKDDLDEYRDKATTTLAFLTGPGQAQTQADHVSSLEAMMVRIARREAHDLMEDGRDV